MKTPFFLTIALLSMVGGSPFGIAETPGESRTVTDAKTIRNLGLRARVYPEEREADVRRLAKSIAVLAATDKTALHDRQNDFQEALLLMCDRGIYETLSTGTIAALDDALEGVFTMDDIKRDTEWEPLIYVYGFFNRDTNAKAIIRIHDWWIKIPPEEREPYYPTYPHAIDAVTKPLAMGPLFNRMETGPALDVAVPQLRSMLLQPPLPGRGFHIPSHAALVLGPLYERWANDPEYGPHVKTYLGTRDEFEALLAGQLIGALPGTSDLPDFAYGFYAYTGRYIANGLARLDARLALPALRQSLEIYQKHNAPDSTIAYTRRALAALGDEAERGALEQSLASGDEPALATVVWLCRNAQGEGQTYAEDLLGKQLGVPAHDALETWFKKQLG